MSDEFSLDFLFIDDSIFAYFFLLKVAMGHRIHPLVWPNLRNGVSSDDRLIVFIRCSFIAMHRTRASRPSDHFRLFYSVRHAVCRTKNVALHSPLEKTASSIVKKRKKNWRKCRFMNGGMNTHTNAHSKFKANACVRDISNVSAANAGASCTCHDILASVSVHGNKEPFDD